MATYIATVDARVIRTVTVEADTAEQAFTKARAEVIALLGAYQTQVKEIELRQVGEEE